MTKKNELKNKLEELNKLEAIADQAWEAYEADPENEELGNAADDAIDAQYNLFWEAVEMLQELAENKIDKITAGRLIKHSRERLMLILA